VLPTQAIFIDDIVENIEAARKEGLIAIQFQDTQKTLEELNRCLIGG
jgi:FMN phosphatase YigB (HAD superfamily)